MHYSSGNNEIKNLENSYQKVFTDQNYIISEWNECLSEFLNQIKLLKENAEKEVCEIGTSLLRFHSSAKELTDQSVSYVSSLMGEVIKGKIDELSTIIERSGLSIEKSEKQISDSKDILDKISSLLNNAVDSLTGFNRIIKHLRTLGISTKIEDSRLNIENTGFHVLAENVENLSTVIADKIYATKRKAAELSNTIVKVFSGNRDKNLNFGSTKNVLQNTRTSLEGLLTNYALCLEKAKTVSTYSETLTQNINEIVVSIQFHDIIRQQLEHVEEAFNALETELKLQDNQIDDTSHHTEVLVTILEVGKIQSAQLKHSRDEFFRACQEIISNMANVNNVVSKLLSDIQKTHEIINNNNDSSLNIIESGIITMKDLLLRSYASNNEFSISVGTVIKTVKDLTVFIYEVEEIGSEIEIIAMNAQVKAAHTGKEGVALGVIAESIQKLSSDSKEQTVTISSFLEQIVNIVSGLVSENSSISEEENNINSIVNEMAMSTNSINDLKRNIENMTIEIKTMAETLQKDIENNISHIGIHNKMNMDVNQITVKLDGLLDNLVRSGINNNQRVSNKLNELQKKYTMQSERLIHEKMTNKSSTSIQKKQKIGEEILDDNIELF